MEKEICGICAGIEYERGCLVKSLAGHDKNEIFVVLREEGEYLYLADGKGRTAEKPKKKKKKHVQLICRKQEESICHTAKGLPEVNAEIRSFIRMSKKSK